MTSDLAARGSTKDLEVAGAGPVHCHFTFPPLFLQCEVPNVAFHSTVVNQNFMWLLFKPSFTWPNALG